MANIAMIIRQGDQYPISVTIYNDDGSVITPNPLTIANVAIYLDGRGKKYDGGLGQLEYDSENQRWNYPLSQTETYALKPGKHDLLIRVKFVGSEVLSDTTLPIEVVASSTKEVL